MRISIKKAAQLLQNHQVIAVPTETVYGLAAWLKSPQAIETLFDLKKRPRENPLIIHVKSSEEALSYISEKPPQLETLMKTFWPGPLTLIAPVFVDRIPEAARAGLTTAAFRMPSHPVLHELLEEISPLVAPSANLSGRPSATSAEHVENDFGNTFPVLDGGACHHGVESTIIAFVEGKWALARRGAIAEEALREVIGYYPEEALIGKRPISPGQLFRHYAPKARLFLSPPEHSVATMVGFSDRQYPGYTKVYYLGSSSNPQEVSHRLYRILRQLDEDGVPEAVVDMQMAEDGLWKTIRERLSKASAF